MSSTNRGSVREISDFYPTPFPVITNLLLHHQLQPGHLLECCAGSGNLNYAIREHYPEMPITSIEIRPEEEHQLQKYGDTYIVDYLQWKPDKKYKTIITNPPFHLAMDVILKSFEIADDDTEIIMLLRLAFLESKSRFMFWQQHPLSKLFVLSCRPSFVGKGTDSAAYGWFIWNSSKEQAIKVI